MRQVLVLNFGLSEGAAEGLCGPGEMQLEGGGSRLCRGRRRISHVDRCKFFAVQLPESLQRFCRRRKLDGINSEFWGNILSSPALRVSELRLIQKIHWLEPAL